MNRDKALSLLYDMWKEVDDLRKQSVWRIEKEIELEEYLDAVQYISKTGWVDDDLGWMIEFAPENEIAAYDYGVKTSVQEFRKMAGMPFVYINDDSSIKLQEAIQSLRKHMETLRK